jgi:hypothetical protein
MQRGALIMNIARVYCVEEDKIVDVYQARALFFAQHEPRRRFEFLCSDDACRANNTTKVTGVNYDKLVEEGDCVVLRPHFRMNPDSRHIDACEWVAQELQRLDSDNGDTYPRRAHRQFRHLKASDLVDVFWPAPAAAPGLLDKEADATVSHSADRESEILGGTRTPGQGRSSNRTRVDFLETVTSAYELLEPEERREATIRIGRGPTLSYQKAFCRIEHYLGVPGCRIFHGGVRVQLHGPNFAVRFFDRIQPYQAGSNVPRTVLLYLKQETLQAHWNGRFLAAQLTEAARPGRYAHCYFFGRLVPHATHNDRLVVNVDTLDHLAFTVRSVKQ